MLLSVAFSLQLANEHRPTRKNGRKSGKKSKRLCKRSFQNKNKKVDDDDDDNNDNSAFSRIDVGNVKEKATVAAGSSYN